MRVAAPRHATSWPPSPSTSSAGNRHPPTEVRSPPHIREDPHDRTVPPPQVGRCPRRVDRARLGGRLRPSGPAQRGPRPDQDRVAGLAERHLQGSRRRPPRRFPALPRHPRQQARRPRGADHHRRRGRRATHRRPGGDQADQAGQGRRADRHRRRRLGGRGVPAGPRRPDPAGRVQRAARVQKHREEPRRHTQAPGHQLRLAHPDGKATFTPFPQTDNFTPYFAKIKQSGAKAVYCFYAGKSAIDFVRQYKQSDIADLPLYAAGFLTEGSVLQAEGPAATGIWTVLNYAPTLDNPTNRAFVSAWAADIGADGKPKHDGPPTTYAMASWDAAALLDRAIADAGPNPTPKTINDAIGRVGRIDSPRDSWQFSAKPTRRSRPGTCAGSAPTGRPCPTSRCRTWPPSRRADRAPRHSNEEGRGREVSGWSGWMRRWYPESTAWDTGCCCSWSPRG